MSVSSIIAALERNSFWTLYLIWLFSSALSGWWFVWVVATGVLRSVSDPNGYLTFESASAGKSFYPFTLGAAAFSFVGVAYYVFKARKGRWWNLPLASIVALVSTVGMVNLYEQIFIIPADLVWRTSYWWQFYGNSFASFVSMVVGVTWVFAALPWWQVENRSAAGLWFKAYLAVMVVWIVTGLPTPGGSGFASGYAYVANTITRFLSQATLVILVAKPLPFQGVWGRLSFSKILSRQKGSPQA